MPDASQMIRDDHQRVKDLFRAFDKEEDTRTRRVIAEHAIAELAIHAVLEEEVFYPAIRHRSDGEAPVSKAREEHHIADLLAQEILDLAASDPRFGAKFTVLVESVRYHFDEEEIVMLPKAAEMGIIELQRLGDKMAEIKERLLTESTPTRKPSTRKRVASAPSRARSHVTRGTSKRKPSTARIGPTRSKQASTRLQASAPKRRAGARGKAA